MNKNTFRTVKLEKGEMHIYDGGAVRLHAYKNQRPDRQRGFHRGKGRQGRPAGIALLL